MGSTFLNILRSDNYSTVDVLINDVDLIHTPRLQKELYDFVERMDYGNLILDLRNTTYIDSTGLATLVNLRNMIQLNGNEMVVVCDVDSILELFKIADMKKYLKVFDSLHSAKNHLCERKIKKVS